MLVHERRGKEIRRLFLRGNREHFKSKTNLLETKEDVLKITRILMLMMIVSLVMSCASFPASFGNHKTFAYGGLLFDDKRIEVIGIDARPIDQVIGLPTRFRMIGNNEFILDSWKPGKYYIDTIFFNVPHGIFGIKQQENMHVALEDKLIFEIMENSITCIGSYHCEIISKFGSADQFHVISQGPEVDKIVLKDIVAKAKGSVWLHPITDYYNQKYSQASPSSSSQI